MERAAHPGLEPPLKMVVWDEGFALPRLITIISQFRQRSKISVYVAWYSSAESVIKKMPGKGRFQPILVFVFFQHILNGFFD
jgi:hypothetical protein